MKHIPVDVWIQVSNDPQESLVIHQWRKYSRGRQEGSPFQRVFLDKHYVQEYIPQVTEDHLIGVSVKLPIGIASPDGKEMCLLEPNPKVPLTR